MASTFSRLVLGLAGLLLAGAAHAQVLDLDRHYLEVPSNPTLQLLGDFTLEVWVFLNSHEGQAGIIGKTFEHLPAPIDVYHANGRLELLWGDGRTPHGVITTSLTPTCVWTHLAIVVQGSSVRFYINGVQDSESVWSTLVTRVDVGTPLRIGSRDDLLTMFDGKMDELRLWSHARTREEIDGQRFSELAGDEPGLMLYYDFNQGVCGEDNTGLVVEPDRSPMGNDGTFMGLGLGGCRANYVCADCPAGPDCPDELDDPLVPGPSDQDGDGIDDVDDCAPLDPGDGEPVPPLRDLRLSEDFGSLRLDWAAADSGMTDPSAHHVLLRGELAALHAERGFASACRIDATPANWFAGESISRTTPSYWYLVRGDNDCGAGALASLGEARAELEMRMVEVCGP
ncbi:MAG: LamG domain-containing protein [Acidobacteriota bacterium]